MINMAIDNTVSIEHKAITVNDILSLHHRTISITLQHCSSIGWSKIGKAMISLPRLETLKLMHCNISSDFYEQLSKHQFLLALHISSDCCTQNIAGCQRMTFKR